MTTLLCDVIAELITARARNIAALDRPVSLFEDKVSIAGKNFSPLKAKVVSGSSIVVTSSNNNAVKNITQELPARKKVAAEYGSVEYFAEVMREIFKAQKVFDDDNEPIDTWGLVAAALGNASNRRSFAQGFFRDEYLPHQKAKPSTSQETEPAIDDGLADAEIDSVESKQDRPPSMKQLLEAASKQYAEYQTEWYNCKKAFLSLQSEFEGRSQI